MPCSRIEHSDSTGGEAQTSNPSIHNLMFCQLSHSAPPKSYQKTIGKYGMMVKEQLIFIFKYREKGCEHDQILLLCVLQL